MVTVESLRDQQLRLRKENDCKEMPLGQWSVTRISLSGKLVSRYASNNNNINNNNNNNNNSTTSNENKNNKYTNPNSNATNKSILRTNARSPSSNLLLCVGDVVVAGCLSSLRTI